MNTQDAIALKDRLDRYEKLTSQLANLQSLFKGLDGGADSPFTGNTRESRKVLNLEITFSKTQGGATGVSQTLDLSGASMPAYDLWLFLRKIALEKKLELEKLIEQI